MCKPLALLGRREACFAWAGPLLQVLPQEFFSSAQLNFLEPALFHSLRVAVTSGCLEQSMTLVPTANSPQPQLAASRWMGK
jgi:hypothetical protein